MIPFIIIPLLIISDQLTKLWVLKSFALYESREIIPGFFSLTYIRNYGAAFGFLNGDYGVWRQIFFVVIAVVAIVIMISMLKQLKGQGAIFVYAVSMIAGGAAGNLIDRIRLGYVVDFLDVYVQNHHWPAFNVADSAITVGVSLFLIGNIFCKSVENGEQNK